MWALDRNPRYVAGFVALLVLAQLRGAVNQVRAGYRPFIHVPIRVPLSWDMFSTAINRCDVRWDPPLVVGDHIVHSMHETGTALEWDPVFDRVIDYKGAARQGCSFAPPSSIATLQCFTAEGREVRDTVRCR